MSENYCQTYNALFKASSFHAVLYRFHQFNRWRWNMTLSLQRI